MAVNPELVERAVGWIANSRKPVVFSGAGVSRESGIPTFREASTGLWAQFDPQQLATVEGFLQDPKLVWEWYAYRRKIVAETIPNPGHEAIAELEKLLPGLMVITQNIDSLHQRAGSRAVIELHGNISRVKCFQGDELYENWSDEDMQTYARTNLKEFGDYLQELPATTFSDFVRIPRALAVATLDAIAEGREKLTRSEVLKIVSGLESAG